MRPSNNKEGPWEALRAAGLVVPAGRRGRAILWQLSDGVVRGRRRWRERGEAC
jgi:hypothetical protein